MEARRQLIAFQKSEKKRIKQEAINAKQDAKIAAKKAKREEKEARKQNILEAKKEQALIDAETKLLKAEEKQQRKGLKSSKGTDKNEDNTMVSVTDACVFAHVCTTVYELTTVPLRLLMLADSTPVWRR
eukprot:SAG11_NODE_953_length_6401_cov_6.463980_4_plen_129_part_00